MPQGEPEASIKNENYGLIPLNETAYSISFFSAEEGILFDHHQSLTTMPVSTSSSGIVDGDYICGVGTVSKLITMYTLLTCAGDSHLANPITNYIPKLKALGKNLKVEEDSIDHASWEDMTLGEVASHMAGIVRDGSCLKHH